jgi:hypothetical protein
MNRYGVIFLGLISVFNHSFGFPFSASPPNDHHYSAYAFVSRERDPQAVNTQPEHNSKYV